MIFFPRRLLRRRAQRDGLRLRQSLTAADGRVHAERLRPAEGTATLKYFHTLGVSINGGTPESSILKGFSLINYAHFWKESPNKYFTCHRLHVDHVDAVLGCCL